MFPGGRRAHDHGTTPPSRRNPVGYAGYGKLTDVDTYLEKLDLSRPLRDPAIRKAIQAIELPEGSRGLDAGCGVGSHTLLLAHVVGPDGNVTGLDVSPEFVAHARGLAEQSSLSERVSFREGNVNELPFDDNTFDWAWSVDCVGHPAVGEPLATLEEHPRDLNLPDRVLGLDRENTQDDLLPKFGPLGALVEPAVMSVPKFLCGESLLLPHCFRQALGESPRQAAQMQLPL